MSNPRITNNRVDRRGYDCQANDDDSMNRSRNVGDHFRRRDYDRMSSSNTSRPMSHDVGRHEKRYRRDDEYYGPPQQHHQQRRRSLDEDHEIDSRNSRQISFHNNSDMREDWKCLECFTWNDSYSGQCRRCSAPIESRNVIDSNRTDSKRDEKDKYSAAESNGEFRKRSDAEMDEFGRRRVEKKSGNKKPREWPPHFETSGHAYVFDTRSGMFYEAESDFFYDPRSKLYYGNKKCAYFRYNPDSKNRFEELKNSDVGDAGTRASGENLNLEPVLLAGPDAADSKSKIGSISIKLKTKSLKASKVKKEKPQETADSIGAAVPKQHVADIEKWTERQVEIRNERKGVVETSGPPEAHAGVKVETTDKGEPICTLCRRKFPTIDKLRYHEKVSTLHKENLAKKEAALKSKESAGGSALEANADAKPVYVDRAKQRRLLHGPETLPGPVLVDVPVPGSTDLSEENYLEPGPKQQALGESNIGNQMLQKLGWKQGCSLGTSGSDPPAATQLANEWSRIESIAASNEKNQRRNARTQQPI